MKVLTKQTNSGLIIRSNGRNYNLEFPEKIWRKYPEKKVLIDNLAHLLTINYPLVANIDKLDYNTSLPIFKTMFDQMVMKGLPHSVEDYKQFNTPKMLKQFMNTEYKFNDSNYKIPDYKLKTNEKAIVSFSAGKDSTLSLALAKEIGLKPVALYINDTVSPTENRMKKKIIEKIGKEFNIKYEIVKNEVEKLNDFETWDTHESCIGYTHMLTSFSFISLPVANYYKSKYVILGNEDNLNYSLTNSDGFNTVPSYDQTREWMTQQNIMIGQMTNNQTKVMSLIEPLSNLALYKILFNRYPEYAKYILSCYGLDASYESRWCYKCSTCANSYVMISAFDDPKKVGLRKNMFNRKYKKYYSIFGGGDVYERSKQSFDENLFAFYLAYKNGAKGYLIDKFKKKYLRQVRNREDELYKNYFSLGKTVTIPENIKKKLFSIYNEELKDI